MHDLLEGIRVLDLTRLLPGPYATMILGDMGARVWKIESPQGGDYARHYQPFVGSMGAFFASINRNKRSVALDLKDDQAREALHALLAQADVLIESFRPGVMKRLGLDLPALQERYPRLVVCSLTGFGRTGPAATEAGHDLTYMARAGLLRGDHVPPYQLADMAGALYAVSGILAALVGRSMGKPAAHLDISMTEAALSLAGPSYGLRAAEATATSQHLLEGAVPCYNLYETAEGRHLAVGALEPVFWQRFCHAVGLEEHLGDGLASAAAGARVTHKLRALMKTQTVDTWMQKLEGLDACCFPVQRAEDVLQDPLFEARQVFFTLEGYEGRLAQVATPLTPRQRSRFLPPPLLGEHTRTALAQAGVSDAVLSSLLSRGAAAVSSASRMDSTS